jgi:transcriptional regulator with XRE-family HTH domain
LVNISDVRPLLHLTKYLIVLIDQFPKPIRATELAERTGLSKAAISKIRERLLEVCDMKKFVWDREFVLSPSIEMLIKLFFIFAASGYHRQFLSSKFVKELIKSKQIHATIVSRFSLYGTYFSEEETSFIFDQLITNLARVDPEDFRFLRNVTQGSSVIVSSGIESIQRILKNLEFSIRTQDELLIMLKLRDKLFFLFRDFIWTLIQDMSILKNMDAKQRNTYIIVYKHTTDFYLRRLFESFNEPLIRAVNRSSIKVSDIQLDIGSSRLEDIEHDSNND